MFSTYPLSCCAYTFVTGLGWVTYCIITGNIMSCGSRWMNKSTQVIGVASVALGAIFTKWLSIHIASIVSSSREWVGSGYEYGDQDSSAHDFCYICPTKFRYRPNTYMFGSLALSIPRILVLQYIDFFYTRYIYTCASSLRPAWLLQTVIQK